MRTLHPYPLSSLSKRWSRHLSLLLVLAPVVFTPACSDEGAVGAGGSGGDTLGTSSGGTTLYGSSGGVNAGASGGTTGDGGVSVPGAGGLGVGGNMAAAGGNAGVHSGGGSSETLDPSGPVYVAPDGDDANPGTIGAPVRTLERARNIVRDLTSDMSADLIVYLRGGTYPLSETLSFTTLDSGRNGHFVKYMAYEGERPVLTGGQPVSGFEVVDASKNLYAAPNVTSRFRQVYVDGVKGVRARTPNLEEDGSPQFFRIQGANTGAHTIQVDSSVVSDWNNLNQVEMHLNLAWADSTLRIASISPEGNTAHIRVQKPEDDILFIRPYPGITQWGENPKAYYFENALEFLDQPGEWYLDETTNVLTYMARPGEDMSTATVVVPQVETLVSVSGPSTDDQVNNLWFEGLTFAHSTYMRPSESGFLDGQAGQFNIAATADNDQYVGRPAAGVSVENANHIHFERNMFTQMAATGLDFISGTHDDEIVGNVFIDIGGSGISVGKFTADEETEFHVPYNPADEKEICTNEIIRNNYITQVTTEIMGACGIACGYPRGIDIQHNEVSELNYTGISVGFGWTTEANAMSNNTIDYNHVHHIGKVLADGAAIYTLSNQGPMSSMQHNYVHDFEQSEWADYHMPALYLDEGTAGYTVAYNVMINTPGWIAENRTGTNTITDNGGDPSGAAETMEQAGIEDSYLDIRDMKLPAVEF